MRTAPTSRLKNVGPRSLTTRLLTAGLFVGAGSALSGCGADQCLSNSQYYEQKVWAEVIATSCIKCHAPEGVAAQKNAKFLQYSQAFPGFLELNLTNITEVAKTQYDGQSILLLKPVGKIDHGGGAVIAEGGPEYAILKEMVRRTSSPVSCDVQTDALAEKVTVLDPAATLRKASLQLSGRLPTDAELASVNTGGEDALSAALDSMMNEKAFLERVKELYNDTLLTGRYSGQGLNLLNSADYPNKFWYRNGKPDDNNLTTGEQYDRQWSDYGISAEALELVAYVAKNNKPFSEILTANYTVVNPYSAKTYGLNPAQLGFASLTDYYEFREAKVSIPVGGTATPLPHAGILTTPVFLNRYPTTTTNINRARARFTFKFFLATDLLAVAERPIDPSSVTSLTPTRDDAYCTSCHKIIDPVASTYQKWDASGRFTPNAMGWPSFMPQPGFGNAIIDNVGQYPAALQWLTKRIVDDPRFAVSVLNIVYRGIMGQEPLAYPIAGDPEFSSKQKAWQAQDRVFQGVLKSFLEGGQNLKLIFKGLIMSNLYRATSVRGLDPAQAEMLGTGRFLTPELLARKIGATLGIRWVRPYDTQRRDYLPTDYNLLYGGIDFDNVVKRLTVPNGIMVSVGQRMANEMSCQAVTWEYTKQPAERVLFKYVKLSEAPEDDNGFPVPDAINNIRRNIQHLHERILGEKLDINDPEIERTYQLFVKTWRELHQAGTTSLPYDCQGRWDRDTGAALMNNQIVVTDDRYYTVRSWMAVLSFLMLDYKFLEE